MKNLIPHQLHLSENQINNLMSGKSTNIPIQHMGSGAGETVVLLNPVNAKKLLSAYKRGKGMRLNLNSDELKGSMIQGRGFKKAMKKTGKFIRNFNIDKGLDLADEAIDYADMGGKEIKRGFNKKIRDSGVGKRIASELIDTSTQVLLPTALGGLSMLMGDPTGMSGAVVGGIAGDQLNKMAERNGYGMSMGEKMARLRAMKGQGLYKALAKKGIKKRPVANALKAIGKEALKGATTVASQAITAYTGNPMAGEMFKQTVDRTGENMIQRGVKKGLNASKKDAMRYAVELVDDYVDDNFSGAERQAIEDAMAGKFSGAADLIYDKVDLPNPRQQGPIGFGIVKRPRGRPRKNVIGTGANTSKPFKRALKANYSGLQLNNITQSNAPIRDFKTDPRVRASSTEMTLSPYQSVSSPAMNPFIPKYYYQEGGQKSGYGGNGLYMPGGNGLF